MVLSPYTPTEIPGHVTMHEVVLMKMREHGDKPAMTDAATGETLTYAQLVSRTERLASALHKLGVRKGDVVVIFLRNHVSYGLIMYACMTAGAIVSTSNPYNTQYELSYHLRDSTAKYVVTDAAHADVVKAVKPQVSTLQTIICDGDCSGTVSLSSLLSDNGSAKPELGRIPFNPAEDVALMPYSSGTTGLPKGVMLTHRNLLSYLIAASHPQMVPLVVPPGQVVTLGLIPFYHVYGLVGFLFGGMAKGVHVIVMEKFHPRPFLAAIEKYKISVLSLVPPLVLFLSKTDYVKEYDLSSVKLVGSGAAPLSIEAENEFRAKLPTVESVHQGYGMTETTVVAISNSPQQVPKPGSVGNLIPNTEGKVVDVDGRVLGTHQRGELCIKGPQIMKGYWNKPEATRESIDDEGFLHTGDIAYYDEDGYFFIVDRIKELIKCKGFQVAPAELEGLLLTHPLVADAGVTGIPHPTHGEVPRAYVTLKPGNSPGKRTEDDIKAYVAERVSSYKKLDGGVIFIPEVPKSPSGKILRRKLKEMALQSKL